MNELGFGMMGKVATTSPRGSPGLEVGVDHPVGKSLPTNPDPLEHSVTRQLVHDQSGVDFPRLLVRIGNHASVEKKSLQNDSTSLLQPNVSVSAGP